MQILLHHYKPCYVDTITSLHILLCRYYFIITYLVMQILFHNYIACYVDTISSLHALLCRYDIIITYLVMQILLHHYIPCYVDTITSLHTLLCRYFYIITYLVMQILYHHYIPCYVRFCTWCIYPIRRIMNRISLQVKIAGRTLIYNKLLINYLKRQSTKFPLVFQLKQYSKWYF